MFAIKTVKIYIKGATFNENVFNYIRFIRFGLGSFTSSLLTSLFALTVVSVVLLLGILFIFVM